LLEGIRNSVQGVSQAVFDPPGEAGEDRTNTSGLIRVRAKRGRRALRHVLKALEDAGVEVQSVEVREPDLEAVFLKLTGRALRD
jgi:ABC-2 type transport system ATP-binding protein